MAITLSILSIILAFPIALVYVALVTGLQLQRVLPFVFKNTANTRAFACLYGIILAVTSALVFGFSFAT